MTLPEGTVRTRADGKIVEKRGKKWVYIGYMPKPDPVFPPVNLPSNVRETSYPGYYISEEGDAYRLPVKGERMPINENGLVYLKPGFRGHAKYPEKQYHCINISLRDENGKFLKQLKECNHRLVAQTFCPNPEGHNEVMHMDDNPRNNHYTNLKWGTHLENMEGVLGPCTTPKSYKITDTRTGKVWVGENLSEWVRENYHLIIPYMKSSDQSPRSISRHMSNARSKGYMIWGFKVEYGGNSNEK